MCLSMEILMRVHKYMAMCGVASRRKSEAIVLEGRVKINNVVVTSLGTLVEENDVVMVDDQVITLEETKVYIMLNKPLECVTTSDDQFNRTTVLDYVDVKERIYPIGRLDYNTTGMLLLTNDGDLANKIMHPSTHLTKTYVAKVKGTPTEGEMKQFESGVMIDDRMTSPAKIKILKPGLVQVQIYEGRNRQVRKMLEAIEHPVITLKRSNIGTLELGNLKQGTYRHLTSEEINYLINY